MLAPGEPRAAFPSTLPHPRRLSDGATAPVPAPGAIAGRNSRRPRISPHVAGTLAETYFRERGLDEPPPATIRFLPRYRYEPQGKYYACVIAAIQAPTREIVAVQLTFLHSGGGRKADVLETRRTVGPAGEGALRLAAVAAHIGIAEGFETAWAAQLMHKLPVWAALGTKRYLKLKLPSEVKRVTIFADPDVDGLLYAEKFRQANPALGVEISMPGAGADDFAKEWLSIRDASKG